MRTLLEVAVGAILGHEPAGRFGLIAADPARLGATGAEGYAMEALSVGRVHQTAGEIGQASGSLQTLILVERPNEGAQEGAQQEPGRLWVVDGWKLLRAAGTRADLRGAPLRGAQLMGARLTGADLSEADLSGADLEKADLSGAILTGATLRGSTLYRAGLRGADLTEAELCRADLQHTDLQETVLTRTALRGADLWEAYLWNVDVSQAFVDGADLDRASRPQGKAAM